MVLEKTLESPLDCKELQPVHSKGDQSWVFIGRTDVEAEGFGDWGNPQWWLLASLIIPRLGGGPTGGPVFLLQIWAFDWKG